MRQNKKFGYIEFYSYLCTMEENKPLLERCSFEFSQDGNCLVGRDASETLIIDVESSLGIDRNDGEVFYVLRTEGWSVDGIKDLEDIIKRVNSCFTKPQNI